MNLKNLKKSNDSYNSNNYIMDDQYYSDNDEFQEHEEKYTNYYDKRCLKNKNIKKYKKIKDKENNNKRMSKITYLKLKKKEKK